MNVVWFLICFICIFNIADGWADRKVRKFPDSFLFGAASAAYQVEGAWDEDGKSESIWDRFLHDNPEILTDGRNGDVATDSYHNYLRDVEMLRELGVDYYRFSISWPRVLPTGFQNEPNEIGLQYYDNLINELLKYSIEPMVTLYHFDLPQALQDLGGWTNPWIVDWFVDYARVIFNRYADRVKFWITINQPDTICVLGYGSSVMAPGIDASGIGEYLCIKNLLLAHAKVYRLYEKEYKIKNKGSVGISIALNWYDPVTNTTENREAAARARDFNIGMYMDPIFKSGDFPSEVKRIIAKKSKEQGFERSRLPVLTAEEMRLLKGSSDFLGMNHYTTSLATPSKLKNLVPSFADDMGVDFSQGKDWVQGKSAWLKSAPYGLYKACLYLNLNYDYPPIIITEHGWSTDAGLRDSQRVEVLRGYLGALLLAMEDGTEVKGYTAWSLMDNVEWIMGTSERFGLYEVDFESEDKKRTARLSALVYKHIIEERIVEDGWKPNSLRISISNRKNKKEEL